MKKNNDMKHVIASKMPKVESARDREIRERNAASKRHGDKIMANKKVKADKTFFEKFNETALKFKGGLKGRERAERIALLAKKPHFGLKHK